MSTELLVSMFESIDNISMLKESIGELSWMRCIIELNGGRRPFCNGSNLLVLDALKVGASGWRTTATTLRPQPYIDLYDAVHFGDLEKAQILYDDFKQFLKFIVAVGLATIVKAGLNLLGLFAGDPRVSLLPPDAQGRAELRKRFILK